MYLLNVNEKKLYVINWKNIVEDFFISKLKEKYSMRVVEGIVSKVSDELQIANLYGDFAIYYNGEYYKICERYIVKVEKSKLLPKFNTDNEFLKKIFDLINLEKEIAWNECKEFDFDKKTIINISESKVFFSEVATYDDFISKKISDYFRGNLNLNVGRKIMKILKLESNVVADFLICHNHYILCIEDGKLELRKRNILVEEIEKVIRGAFNFIELDCVESLISDICNKVCYDFETFRKEIPLKILKWDCGIVEAVAELYVDGNRLKFFKSEDLGNVWVSVPLSEDLISKCHSYESFEEIFELNPKTCRTLSEIFRALKVPKCYFRDKSANTFIFDGEKIIEVGESELVEKKLIVGTIRMD